MRFFNCAVLVMKLFQALPRRVHSDDDLSTVSALSIDATFDEYIDCDTDNFIIAQTSDWSHHNDDEDDDDNDGINNSSNNNTHGDGALSHHGEKCHSMMCTKQ